MTEHFTENPEFRQKVEDMIDKLQNVLVGSNQAIVISALTNLLMRIFIKNEIDSRQVTDLFKSLINEYVKGQIEFREAIKKIKEE